jgi:creatinine amidohydrolase/Fe(II)-dependent formamide hydrolase-like protein
MINPNEKPTTINSAQKHSDLSNLKVISKLEIGPVRIERNKVCAPYKVTPKKKGEQEDIIDFVYRFEEDVFDPDEYTTKNLASIMVSQVALNYGLFCDEIVFIGSFDEHDKKFILEMAKNTAREIFVKKFLEHNPFIIGVAKNLAPVKQSNYLQAKLKFIDQFKETNHCRVEWKTNEERYTILSSGGKDSLLSFGLLKELGMETHPIFINESGRHWFTALNAYRHFSKNIPRTTRVWTNSDRVFNWMLRHLPFVRQDFANLRADEYPIRLWSVAIFIFGVLPILKKRGIEYLVIGDEYDTTAKHSFKGITHYNGLFDQSRYFDNAMSIYFASKGWNIVQFSILRQLSEILIEKILVERYPKLQLLQVSCHASHKEGEIIKPCGKCEKCRRIVGMLLAIDSKPENCGYTKTQVEACIKDLAKAGVAQEREAVQHLGYILKQKGILQLENNFLGQASIGERPEIFKLRFDKERAPINEIPISIRAPLYHILLEHADGALKRNGQTWEDFNPLSAPDLFKPNTLTLEVNATGKLPFIKKIKHNSEAEFLLERLTWPEAKKRFKEVDVALLPVGSIEQHGYHLPLDTDSFDADYLACEVAAACSNPKPIVLPLIPYGVSYHHEDFSGTISVSPKTLSNMVYEVGLSAAKHGVKKLVIINGHGGNTPSLQFAAQMINRDTTIFTCVETGETSDRDIAAITETPNDVHAGEVETSTTLAVRPDMVRSDKINKFIPKFSSRFLNFSSKRSVEWYTRTVNISKSGVLGDPTIGDAKKGEKIWSVMIANLVEFVEDLKRMTLDEIYQRRY